VKPEGFAALGDLQPVATLTVGELKKLLAEQAPCTPGHDADVLLTTEGVAQLLGCSTRHVRRLRKDGLPVVWLGDAPRFERDAALEWLRARSVQASKR
jgi:excisionase family DNA binding protein